MCYSDFFFGEGLTKSGLFIISKMSIFHAMEVHGCKTFNTDSVAWLGIVPWSLFFLPYNLVERRVFLSVNRNHRCFFADLRQDGKDWR